MLKEVYNADAVALIPGGGTYGMEAVARQFARDAKTLGGAQWLVLVPLEPDLSRPAPLPHPRKHGAESGANQGNDVTAPFAPAPIEEVVARRSVEEKPDVVFAPHVETSAGVILPDAYVKEMAAAAHEVGALMVLDCIASGCAWIDMKEIGVDVLMLGAAKRAGRASPSAGSGDDGRIRALKRVWKRPTSDSFRHRSEEVAFDHAGL